MEKKESIKLIKPFEKSVYIKNSYSKNRSFKETFDVYRKIFYFYGEEFISKKGLFFAIGWSFLFIFPITLKAFFSYLLRSEEKSFEVILMNLMSYTPIGLPFSSLAKRSYGGFFDILHNSVNSESGDCLYADIFAVVHSLFSNLFMDFFIVFNYKNRNLTKTTDKEILILSTVKNIKNYDIAVFELLVSLLVSFIAGPIFFSVNRLIPFLLIKNFPGNINSPVKNLFNLPIFFDYWFRLFFLPLIAEFSFLGKSTYVLLFLVSRLNHSTKYSSDLFSPLLIKIIGISYNLSFFLFLFLCLWNISRQYKKRRDENC